MVCAGGIDTMFIGDDLPELKMADSLKTYFITYKRNTANMTW